MNWIGCARSLTREPKWSPNSPGASVRFPLQRAWSERGLNWWLRSGESGAMYQKSMRLATSTRGGKRDKEPVLMLLAHTDTVFPPSTPITVERDGDILRGPGIGDNSVSVSAMISTLDVLDALGEETAVDLVAVADVGEEGLGNLRGARAATERYRENVGAVPVLDGTLGQITHIAVGSQRWRITVRGPGGHSYGDFGLPSAIHGLGRIIAAIADITVPRKPKTTTFNVGVIEGGTSVNTIAERASALLDMRSTEVKALDQL